MRPSTERLLQRILSQPTAPFREGLVRATLMEALKAGRVPHFLDRAGNLIVGAASLADYRKKLGMRTSDPALVFIAHMDHPGFHGVEWVEPTELRFEWFGGSPTALHESARVWLAEARGPIGEGSVAHVQMHESGRFLLGGTIRCEPGLSERYPKPRDLCGGFVFREPWWLENDRYYTQVADDLVGCFAIVATALDLWAGKGKAARKNFIGLLTRGEEVGFIGTLAHLEEGSLLRARRPRLVVSLETSRTLPGAEIGKGPVVRLGDRATVFEAGALQVFSELAVKTLPDRHQRRIMDGGSCEATAATAYGLPAIGISVPLGNYHNQGLEGGPDARMPNGPSPEFVHRDDIIGLLALCGALTRVPGAKWRAPWVAKRAALRKGLAKYRRHLG